MCVYVSGSGAQLFSTHIRGPGDSSVRNFPKFVLGTDTDDVPPGARCYSLEFSVSTMQLITVFFCFCLCLFVGIHFVQLTTIVVKIDGLIIIVAT